MAPSKQMNRALAAYWSSLKIVDPLRFEVWGKAHITMPLLRVLVQLREYPGSSTGEIANHLGVTPSAVTGLIDRLVDLELVRREPHPHDRRVSCNFLEEAGGRVLGEQADRSNAFVGEVLSELSHAEIESLTIGLERLYAAADAVRARRSNGARTTVAAGARV
jgi:DNA-binding MarR family transcriptional regulator